MPLLNPVFTVNAPIGDVWNYMNDMVNIGEAIPGGSVEIVDEKISNWAIKAKMGPIAKTLRLTTTVLERNEDRHYIKIEGTGEFLDVFGEGSLVGISEGETEVSFNMELSAKGGAKGLIDNIIKTKTGEYQEAFVESIKKGLES